MDFLILTAILGVGLFIGIFVLLGLLMVSDEHFRTRPMAEAIEREFPMGEEAIFTGCYVSNQEIAIFTWDKSGAVWNKDHLKCELVFPHEDSGNWLTEVPDPDPVRSGFKTFEVEFRGKIIEKGRFGHVGMCRYRIEVLEILSARQRSGESESLLRSSDLPEKPSEELLRPAKESAQADPGNLLRPSESRDAS